MKTDIFRFFQERSEIKFNRRVFVFLVCLIISFIIWLQINLSKEHVENVPVKIDFVNLPKAKFGTTKLSENLLVEVEADGYALFKYETKEVSIDFKKLRKDHTGAYYFLPNNYTKTIAKQLGDDFKVIRSITDTLLLNTSLK